MIRHVCYHDEPCSSEDRLFQIVAFRTFSKIETWRSVRDFLGRYPTLDDLGDASFIKRWSTPRTGTVGFTLGRLSSVRLTRTARDRPPAAALCRLMPNTGTTHPGAWRVPVASGFAVITSA
ncbi:MAG: nucleotide kinase domain-containing protein [Egibacteraceae bacterium]